MADPYDELTELELMQRGVPRITVRPLGVEAPPPNDMAWGRPAAEGGRPTGRLFEPDLTPAEQPSPHPMGALAARSTYDPTFSNRYTTTVQEPGQPDRQVFELPVVQQHRERYERPGLAGHLFGGARAVEPPQRWDPDRPRAGLGAAPQQSTLDRALDYGAVPARMIAGMVTPPVDERSILDRYPDPNEPLTPHRVGREMQRQQALDKFGVDTALNMIGAGRLPGAAPPGAIGVGGGQAPRTLLPEFKTVRGAEPSEPGYVYHATSRENVRDIAESGKLNVHKPHEFTDQTTWPDGARERRNYFTPSAENTWQFAPEEGSPVLLRMRQDVHPIRRESTGDLYSTKPVPAEQLEYLGTDNQWHPVKPKVDPGSTTLGAGSNDPRSVALGAGASATRDPRMGSILSPIRAYHSSPHDFDKFDVSKIGTGEGAQVYGHGLYFAENPKVSGQGGQYWQQFKNRFAYNPAEMEAVSVLENHDFNRAKAIEELEDSKKYDAGYIGGATNAHDRANRERIVAKNHEALEILKSGRPVGPRTYEVNINARPEQMLDWDKRLAQQSPEVQKAVAGFAPRNKLFESFNPGNIVYAPEMFGSTVYNTIASQAAPRMDPLRSVGIDKPLATQTLREAGIPGIRYLDQGSRFSQALHNDNPIANEARRFIEVAGGDTQKAGELFYKSNPVERWASPERDEIFRLIQQGGNKPTSNYVVFDPGIVDIVKKYGIVGGAPVGMGALAAQDRYNPRQ